MSNSRSGSSILYHERYGDNPDFRLPFPISQGYLDYTHRFVASPEFSANPHAHNPPDYIHPMKSLFTVQIPLVPPTNKDRFAIPEGSGHMVFLRTGQQKRRIGFPRTRRHQLQCIPVTSNKGGLRLAYVLLFRGIHPHGRKRNLRVAAQPDWGHQPTYKGIRVGRRMAYHPSKKFLNLRLSLTAQRVRTFVPRPTPFIPANVSPIAEMYQQPTLYPLLLFMSII